ncbi:MAG: hypothetical protein N3A54_00410 [Patescibacteria group bacterium]|nr:hypothetical protein [Patescibacteria group bacterium]
MEERNLIETEVPGIYRDPENHALIIKKDQKYKELIRRIKDLERRIENLEQLLNNQILNKG